MHPILRLLIFLSLDPLVHVLVDFIRKMFQGEVDQDTAIFLSHVDQVIDVESLLHFHPQHNNMEETHINKDLGPDASSFANVIDYASVNLVTKEAPSSIGGDACHDHVEEMIGDNVVLELHVEV